MKSNLLIMTCEHAVNVIPHEYQSLFLPHRELLSTHKAIDLGALEIAQHLSSQFNCELFSASASRLLIDCNRSLHDPHCFSEITHPLPPQDKEAIITNYYLPFRNQVEECIRGHIKKYQVLHLSIHSFTPVLNGVVRNAGIGLLYDPKRHGEKEVARLWRGVLECESPYRVRMNYPYRGTSDGFASALRKRYSEVDYLGFEVEVNQELVEDSLDEIIKAICLSLEQLLLLL